LARARGAKVRDSGGPRAGNSENRATKFHVALLPRRLLR
jgi:hypothetical protein